VKNLSTEVPVYCEMTSPVTLTGSIVPFGSLPLFSCSSSSRCIRIWRACVSLKRMEIIPLRLRLVKRFFANFLENRKNLDTGNRVWHRVGLLSRHPTFFFKSNSPKAQKFLWICMWISSWISGDNSWKTVENRGKSQYYVM